LSVAGVDLDYEVLGKNNGMLGVTASGTALRTLEAGRFVDSPSGVAGLCWVAG
jgi:hypothetical protein